jgi:hypothetical protein
MLVLVREMENDALAMSLQAGESGGGAPHHVGRA